MLTVIDGNLWRETKQLLKYKAASSPLRNANNSFAILDVEKAEIFQTHLSKTFHSHENISIP
jgi:hypothetical protein